MILLIGGTSETAPLAEGLARAGYEILVSTATEAPLAIGDHPRISRRSGRLDEEGLVALGKEKRIRAIVDAAHPYAVAAHAAVQEAAARLGIPCLAFRRAETLSLRGGDPAAVLSTAVAPFLNEASKETCPGKGPAVQEGPEAERIGTEERGGYGNPADGDAEHRNGDAGEDRAKDPGDKIRLAADHAEAARMAFADGRPVLLTTGSRNLAPYAQAARRTGIPLAVRILDAPESLAACRAAGIPEERIITGRGPFSINENLTAIGRFSVGVIVTKESGRAGGIEEKLAAAEEARCRVIVVRRPEATSDAPAFDQPSTLIAALQDLVPFINSGNEPDWKALSEKHGLEYGTLESLKDFFHKHQR